jgi:hypothetical protein
LARSKEKLSQKIIIVTEAFDGFPVSVLYNSLKFSFEKLNGFGNQMRQTLDLAFEEFGLHDEERLKSLSNKLVEKRMIFASVFLHSVLTERSYLGYMGFNSKIECNENDLIMLLKLTFKAVEVYNTLKGATETKEDLSKSPVFQQLARQIASFVYGSRIEN